MSFRTRRRRWMVCLPLSVQSEGMLTVTDSIRILKPGGHLGFTTWHLLPGFVADLEAAFKSFPFDAPFQWTLQTTAWGDWANANWVKKALAAKGLEDIKVDLLAHLSRVNGPDEFISHFS